MGFSRQFKTHIIQEALKRQQEQLLHRADAQGKPQPYPYVSPGCTLGARARALVLVIVGLLARCRGCFARARSIARTATACVEQELEDTAHKYAAAVIRAVRAKHHSLPSLGQP